MKWILLLTLCLCALSVPAWAQDPAALAVPLADVSVTGTAVLMDANTFTRASLSCTNHSTTVNVRWGDATVTASQGQRFPAGSSIEIRIKGPIYMISEGAAVTVSCTRETR